MLGVAKTASDKEITKAYRKLAKQFHPDANPGNSKAEDKFKDVSAAYDVLNDAAKRKEYDEVRKMAGSGVPFGGGRGGNPFGGAGAGPAQSSARDFRFEDLGDLFGGLFGAGRNGRQRGGGPQRGDDLTTDLHLSFVDAVNGLTTDVNVTSDAPCQTCRGSGAQPGTAPVACSNCGGRGVLDDNQGVFSFSRPCDVCGGSGRRVEHPCKTCRGSCVQRRSRAVKVRIPAGVDDNQRIRLKGKAGSGRNGGPAGDLYVTMHVAPHPIFGRRGKDLTLTLPVSFTEAALGAAVKVPTLTTPVTVKVPAGSKSGRTLRVRERGVPGSSKPGDLLVTIEINVPSNPSAEERQLIESLGQSINGDTLRRHLGAD